MRGYHDFFYDDKRIPAHCFIEVFSDEKPENVNQLFALFATEAERENGLKLRAIVMPFEAVTSHCKVTKGYRLKVSLIKESRKTVSDYTWRRACQLLAGRLSVALSSPSGPVVTFPDGQVVSVTPR